jgi:polyhydroxybutyrate depolymerase
LLYVPDSYNRSKAAPLVISLHGAAGWPAQQMNMSRWNRLADQYGFILVCPAGTEWPRIWHVGTGTGLNRDVQFISDLIDKLTNAYNIDPNRIYVNGLSNGGGMTFVLSCKLSNRIAAVGLVSAAETLPFDWCTDHHPVPMIAFHGTADLIVPFNGGWTGDKLNPVKTWFPPVLNWAERWARRNGCDTTPIKSAAAVDVTRIQYEHCSEDANVVLYVVAGGGHSWPGGKALPRWWVGVTSNSIDATSVMWAFFREHPLKRR